MKVQQVDDDDDGNDNDVDNQDDNDTDNKDVNDIVDNNYYDNDDARVVTGHMFERQLKAGIFLKANHF